MVLLADVDKQGLSDLVKLLNRQASLQHVCSITTSHPLVIAALEHPCPCDKASVCRYKLRAKVDIADVSSEYTTWARFGPGLMPEGICPLYSNHTRTDFRGTLTFSRPNSRQCLACLPLLITLYHLFQPQHCKVRICLSLLELAISPEHSSFLCTRLSLF